MSHSLALVQHQGRWHLYAQEPESAQTKTFLLRRIVSQVTTTAWNTRDSRFTAISMFAKISVRSATDS